MRGWPAEGTLRNFALTAPGLPVFGDLRRCNAAEWKRGPVAPVTGWRWNGADPPSPSYGAAKGGTGFNWRNQAPAQAEVSGERGLGDSSAVGASPNPVNPFLPC